MPRSADTLIVGASVRTLDPARPTASAVAVAGGLITALDDDAVALRGPGTEIIDLAGATLTPGLVDGHTHPLLGVEQFSGLDLSGCRDVADLRARLASAARESARGDWVRGYGLDHNVFAGQPITSASIDDVLAGVPAFLRLYDGHSALASGTALALAGIDRPREFGQRAHISCDEAGHPTGHLVEHAAMDLIYEVMPEVPLADRRERALELLAAMAATGLTGGHVMDGADAALDLLASIETGRDLPLRLRLAPWCMPGNDPADLIGLQRRRGRRWRVGAVKFFIDGTVEGGTAWLDQPDCHGQSCDSFWLDPADYTSTVRGLAAAGVQTCTHAIGDAGVGHVIDTLADASAGGVRHRVEHLETMPDDLVKRLAASGLVASMQPSHTAYTRADHSDEWSRRLGPERADRAWRCRDVRDAGVVLVLGSDWPVADYDARLVLGYARDRTLPGSDVPPVTPEQALTGLQSLEGMTSHAALAANEENVAGRVAPGYRADLTAFSLDPVTAPADEVADAPIRLTMVDGAVTHRAAAG
jgi:predicted amidohydrolase YtcJ